MGMMGRTVFIGQPKDEQLRVWEANVKVHEIACDVIKPGVKCSDVARVIYALYSYN